VAGTSDATKVRTLPTFEKASNISDKIQPLTQH